MTSQQRRRRKLGDCNRNRRLSEFHIMIFTVLKVGYIKRVPKIILYRDDSRFSAGDVRTHLIHMVSSEVGENETYGAFKAVAMAVLNEHAPVQKKIYSRK